MDVIDPRQERVIITPTLNVHIETRNLVIDIPDNDPNAISFTRLPDSVIRLRSLLSIDVRAPNLSSLHPDLHTIPTLRKIIINSITYQTIGTDLRKMTRLTHLEFRNTSITRISGNFPRLNILELTNNQRFQGFYSGVLNNLTSSLRKLIIRKSDLQRLPNAIGSLTSLTELTITDSPHLSTLPDTIGDLGNLQVMEFSHCGLTHLPPYMGRLYNLIALDLSYNQIAHVPSHIGNMENLRALDLKYNKIRTLPEEISNLRILEILSVRDNLLETLPRSLSTMTNLRKLVIDNNPFVELYLHNMNINHISGEFPILRILELTNNRKFREFHTDAFKNLTALQRLIIMDSPHLFELPGTIGFARDLRELKIMHCGLTKLPPSIGTLQYVTALDLSYNRITHIPNTIGDMESIRELDLSHNKIRTLPEEISNLRFLETLLVNDNLLKTIPDSLLRLHRMHEFHMYNNPLRLEEIASRLLDMDPVKILDFINVRLDEDDLVIEPSIFGDDDDDDDSISHLTKLPDTVMRLRRLFRIYVNAPNLLSLHPDLHTIPTLKEIVIVSRAYRIIGRDLRAITRLTHLELYDTSITRMSGQFPNLLKLELCNNRSLSTFSPTTMRSLTALKFFTITDSPLLSKIPNAIGDLRDLRKLWIALCGLTQIPPSIGRLRNLITLDLSYNQIAHVPSNIGNMENLRTLDLKYNKIRTLPEEISNLRNLFVLWVDNNQLQFLPASLETMPNLRFMDVSGNPLVDPASFPERLLTMDPSSTPEEDPLVPQRNVRRRLGTTTRLPWQPEGEEESTTTTTQGTITRFPTLLEITLQYMDQHIYRKSDSDE
jgi:Leucine-rich repeat (LRR) protein